MNKIKNIIINFIKNVVAYAMPVALLQFIVQPMIAIKVGEELNGLFLTIIAFNYFLSNITAATLLQTRLLLNKTYEDKKIKGDFNVILLSMACINAVLMTFGVIFYGKESITLFDIVMCVIISLLFLVHDYVCVQYRAELDFTKILMSNIVLCIGYIAGTIVFIYIYQKWQVIFIIAYTVCEIYDLTHTDYLREKIIVTPLMRDTLNKYFTLAGASLLSYIVSYGDRMLLYPVTDGATVSVFTSAEIMGKMLMLLGSPLSAFLLSYIVKVEKIEVSKIRKKYILYAILFFMGSYLACVGVSIPMLHILYPKWADRSLVYVPFVTLTSMLNLLSMIINVVLVRFCHAKWQVIINATYLISYLVLSFTFLHFNGLMGFCFGNIMAAAVKVIFMIIIIYRCLKAEKMKLKKYR